MVGATATDRAVLHGFLSGAGAASTGSPLPRNKAVTRKGLCTVIDDDATMARATAEWIAASHTAGDTP